MKAQRPCYFCAGFIFHDGWQEVGVHQTACPELRVPHPSLAATVLEAVDAPFPAMISEVA